MPVPIRTRLGPYEIIAFLGAGAMGEVYKARDTRLDRVVAIKKLTGAHSDRFQQEARALAALNHPHICQLYDLGPDYLVMEYIDGTPLQSPLPVDEALRLAMQIASALEAAHRRGVLHRDLKPTNIMVTTAGAAKVLDFGLARLVAEDPEVTRTADGTLLGTPAYMAPEQAEGGRLDARSDVFSFGAVLYELLSGSRAFQGSSTAHVLSAVLRDDPRPLHAPPTLQRLVMRCLAKDPDQRFQSMEEVRTALEQASKKQGDVEPSIAVLPFANLSADKENEYFSDGLAEEIINLLAQLPGLKVAARTSAFAFRGKEQDIRKIAEALDVRTILEGSVRRAGSRIRVTAQLVNAENGYHLWSQRYDRELADVFAIQDEIAQAITAAFQVQLSAEPPVALRRYTPSLPAYEAYLKARHQRLKLTLESMARSKEYHEQAIALDPQFAMAYVERASYFVWVANFHEAHEAMPLAREAARKALDIDPALSEAHALLGSVAAVYEYDWKEAEREFQLALARGPVSSLVRDYYATFYLLVIGRARAGVVELEHALEEDPLDLNIRAHLALCLEAAGFEADAAAQFRQLLELDETFWKVYCKLCADYALRGMIEVAVACAEKAYALAPWDEETIGALAGLLVRTGDTTRAEELLQKLRTGSAYAASIGFLIFYLLCRDIESAADWAEKAIEQRHLLILFYLRAPLAEPLRTSARWPAIARLANLPEAVP